MESLQQTISKSLKPKLLDQVRQDLRTKHYSRKTEESYLHWIKQYILYHKKRHPNKMGFKEINEFLTHLAVDKKVASSTQNQALCSIVFLYKSVLKQEFGQLDGVVWARKAKKLPVVLTRDEVKLLLSNLSGVKQLMANLIYGAGLRLKECLQLRVKDVDFGYKQITIRSSKGDKDRITVLPEARYNLSRNIFKK